MKSHEEILADIDMTLDQLIKNAQISAISGHQLHHSELEALQKTQESLIAHLLHMNIMVEKEKGELVLKKNQLRQKEFEKKIQTFERLNTKLVQTMKKHLTRKPRIGRNRKTSKTHK